jgi:hypothetical protein
MTKVVNIANIHEDWESDPDYVYIGRGSKWGNPWIIGNLTRREVIERYETDLQGSDLLADLHELEGKFLVCHCAPLPCHGDVLVKWLETQ